MTSVVNGSPGSAVAERRVLVLLAGLAVLLGLGGHLRTAPPATPPRIAPEQAELWMADALPGVGPARRAAALEAIHARAWDRLPKPARSLAREVFSE
jgi:hypothetical protein